MSADLESKRTRFFSHDMKSMW